MTHKGAGELQRGMRNTALGNIKMAVKATKKHCSVKVDRETGEGSILLAPSCVIRQLFGRLLRNALLHPFKYVRM